MFNVVRNLIMLVAYWVCGFAFVVLAILVSVDWYQPSPQFVAGTAFVGFSLACMNAAAAVIEEIKEKGYGKEDKAQGKVPG